MLDAIADPPLHGQRARETGVGRELGVHRLEVGHGCRPPEIHVEPEEATSHVVIEAPDPLAAHGRPEPVTEAGLVVQPWGQRQRLDRPVAEPRVNEPPASVGQRHRECEVVSGGTDRLRGSSVLHSRDVSRHIDTEPGEERRERAVQVVAVPTAATHDPARGCDGVDAGRPAEDDVDGLVRDLVDVRPLESTERRCVHCSSSDLDLEELEVRMREVVREDLRECHRGACRSTPAARGSLPTRPQGGRQPPGVTVARIV